MQRRTSQLLLLLEKADHAQAVLQVRGSDRGLADTVRFPFVAIVGQVEMKTALILTLINPHIGGVLLMPHLPPTPERPVSFVEGAYWVDNWAGVLLGLILGALSARAVLRTRGAATSP